MRIAYIDHTEGKHTIDNLSEGLKKRGHTILKSEVVSGVNPKDVDILWVEHLGRNAIDASHITSNKPLVLRLSAMELYKQKMEIFNWKNVQALVVHGQHLKDYFLERFGYLPADKIHVIPLCIDTEHYSMRKEPIQTFKVAVVSEMHWRKGVQLIPEILESLSSEYTIHHVGKVVNWDAKNYVDWKIKELGLKGRYFYEGELKRASLVSGWLEDKTYILHPSYTEGMPRAVFEAMSKGIKPIVHRYRGSYKQVIPEYCHQRISGLASDISKIYVPERYREFVLDKYSIPVVAEKAEKLCVSLTENQ